MKEFSLIRKQFKLSLLIFSLLLVGGTCLYADSLWDQSEQTSFYNQPKRRISVGDTVTIRISEQTSAVQEASTKTDKQSSLELDLLANWDQVSDILGNESVRRRLDSSLTGGDSYNGLGQTTRRSRVQAVVTAVVTEILDSGNLYVVGEHKVKVNDEVETIRISGIIRPVDIRPDNSIFSYQLAKAEVSVHGAGVVGSKQTPGVMTRMFNWLF